MSEPGQPETEPAVRPGSASPSQRPPTEGQPLSAVAYAVMALLGAAFGLGLLVFYVHKVPELIASGVGQQVFYVLLLPWGLSCAVFLFGAMRSFAQITSNSAGSAVEVGGPAALFVLVVVGGFRLVPSPEDTFDLTVRMRSADGKNPIVTRGKLTLDLDHDRRTRELEPTGEVTFKGIPRRFLHRSVKVLPEVEGYLTRYDEVRVEGRVLDLVLERESPRAWLVGTVVPAPGDKKVVRLCVDGDLGEGTADALGRFRFEVGAREGDRIRLRAYVGTTLAYDDYQTLPGPITISIE